MAPKTRQPRKGKQGKAKAQYEVQATEVIEVEHGQNGRVVTILALKTSDDQDPDLNWITKACAQTIGFPTELNPGETTKIIKPVWSLPLTSVGATYDKDEFLVVDTASHGIVFGQTVSEKIAAAKRESPALAVHVRWVQEEIPSLRANFAVHATA